MPRSNRSRCSGAADARDDHVQVVDLAGSTCASERDRKSACFWLLPSRTTRSPGAISACRTATMRRSVAPCHRRSMQPREAALFFRAARGPAGLGLTLTGHGDSRSGHEASLGSAGGGSMTSGRDCYHQMIVGGGCRDRAGRRFGALIAMRRGFPGFAEGAGLLLRIEVRVVRTADAGVARNAYMGRSPRVPSTDGTGSRGGSKGGQRPRSVEAIETSGVARCRPPRWPVLHCGRTGGRPWVGLKVELSISNLEAM